MKILTDTELNKIPTHRLINMLRIANKWYSSIVYYAGRRCCELCHEYIGNDWEKDVGQHLEPIKEYKERIKAVLATRPHCDKTHARS